MDRAMDRANRCAKRHACMSMRSMETALSMVGEKPRPPRPERHRHAAHTAIKIKSVFAVTGSSRLSG